MYLEVGGVPRPGEKGWKPMTVAAAAVTTPEGFVFDQNTAWPELQDDALIAALALFAAVEAEDLDDDLEAAYEPTEAEVAAANVGVVWPNQVVTV